MRRTTLLLPILLAALVPCRLTAQESATSPGAPQFHAGQWGAQFAVSNGFYGVGALRFTSPSTAWAFSGNIRAAHNAESRGSQDSDLYGGGVSVGRRWYRPGAGRVRPFSELGISTAYSWNRADYGDYGSKQQGYGAGGYAQVGAMVFLAPELSVGGAWGASLGYSHDHYETTGPYPTYSTDRSGVYLEAGRLQLVGALYF